MQRLWVYARHQVSRQRKLRSCDFLWLDLSVTLVFTDTRKHAERRDQHKEAKRNLPHRNQMVALSPVTIVHGLHASESFLQKTFASRSYYSTTLLSCLFYNCGARSSGNHGATRTQPKPAHEISSSKFMFRQTALAKRTPRTKGVASFAS